MSQDVVFEPSKALARNAHIDNEGYKALYEKSLADPDAFWAEQGQRIDWMRPYSQISDVSYDATDLHIRWYADGTLNAAANCLDRHLATRGDQTAIIWEGDNPETQLSLIRNSMKKCVNFQMFSRPMERVRVTA